MFNRVFLPARIGVLFVALLLVLLVNASAFAVDEYTVFHTDFDGPDCLQGWSGGQGQIVEGYKGTSGLLVERKDAESSTFHTIQIPAEKIKGRLINFRATVKAEGVTKPPQSWSGVKVMLVLETPDGKDHPQISLPVGTFDWTESIQTYRVPENLLNATLLLGLELVSGKVWFDNVDISLGRPYRGGKRSETMFKGHDLPRLRGVMYGPTLKEEDIKTLGAEWGANQIRWQLNWIAEKTEEEAKDLNAYDRWLDGRLGECDKAVATCEKYGIKVLVDLHTAPGGSERVFTDKASQDKFVEVWEKIAKRYKGRQTVYAYDLLNEPIEPVVGKLMGWRELAENAARKIRAVDPDKPIVVEPPIGGGPDGFDVFLPLDMERIIYSFHMYKPHSFTHQGIYGIPIGPTYPSTYSGVMIDKEWLRATMQPAIDFQREFNVQLYIGEFSAIRWAPDNSAYRYLKDLTDLFEEYGWDWSYHAFREWDGWSVEHGTDKNDTSPSKTQTDREKLLRGWFSKCRETK